MMMILKRRYLVHSFLTITITITYLKMRALSLLALATAATASALPGSLSKRAGTTANGTNVVSANWDGSVRHSVFPQQMNS